MTTLPANCVVNKYIICIETNSEILKDLQEEFARKFSNFYQETFAKIRQRKGFFILESGSTQTWRH